MTSLIILPVFALSVLTLTWHSRDKILKTALGKKIWSIIIGFWEGILTIRSLRSPTRFILHTILIWVCYYLMTYLMFFSFVPTENLAPVAGLVVFVFGTLGIVIPSPGGMGTYQFLISEGLLLTVVGARPQFVKAAALSRSIAKSSILQETIVHSGQHYDHNLSGDFFSELNIPKPKYNLGIGSMSHNKMMGHFLIAFDDIIDQEQPDMILVYGDTNTTSAAAIAAAKRNIPLAHVEAGLREWDKTIPEEVNKLLTDSVTDLYFSPTQTGVDNLAKVGITKNVFLTGDISLDLLFSNTQYIAESALRTKYNLTGDYIFMTCHRDANTSDKDKISNILRAVSSASHQVIFAMHPRTKNAINKYGIQHLIIDKQTEWVETLAEGWNVVTGPDENAIKSYLQTPPRPIRHTNALGNGECGNKIVTILEAYLTDKD